MPSTEVLIIESRSSSDHFEGRHEGRILKDILHLEGVPTEYFEVLDKEHLEKALDKAEYHLFNRSLINLFAGISHTD